MVLDPKSKQRLKSWWLHTPMSRHDCPGCGVPSPGHDVIELSEKAVMFACELCGHAYVFDCEKLKKRAGIKNS